MEKGESVLKLSFIVNPDVRLQPSERMVRKVYESQIRNLGKKLEDKQAAISFVDYLHNLTPEQQDTVTNAPFCYFIPWHMVFNENSVSTSCRLVLMLLKATMMDAVSIACLPRE